MNGLDCYQSTDHAPSAVRADQEEQDDEEHCLVVAPLGQRRASASAHKRRSGGLRFIVAHSRYARRCERVSPLRCVVDELSEAVEISREGK